MKCWKGLLPQRDVLSSRTVETMNKRDGGFCSEVNAVHRFHWRDVFSYSWFYVTVKFISLRYLVRPSYYRNVLNEFSSATKNYCNLRITVKL
jgi:hypothetical protein